VLLGQDALRGAGGKVAFVDHHDGDWDLYIVDKDGTGLRQLTDLPSDEYAPTGSRSNRSSGYHVTPDTARGGPKSLPLARVAIHRSAWKGYSANFGLTAF
jgi:Tol biopolymer transport system component